MASALKELLHNYEVDPVYAFLLPNPLQKLPPEFEPWHEITGVYLNSSTLLYLYHFIDCSNTAW